MLDEGSYLTAIYIYVGSASVLLMYLAWWLSRHWSPGWVALAVLLMAALLLTPAYPKVDADTVAPALIVATFEIMTTGVEAADYALRPLMFAAGVAVVLALLLRMTVFRRRKKQKLG
jgi:tellurite resistance protein TehA-like permease